MPLVMIVALAPVAPRLPLLTLPKKPPLLAPPVPPDLAEPPNRLPEVALEQRFLASAPNRPPLDPELEPNRPPLPEPKRVAVAPSIAF